MDITRSFQHIVGFSSEPTIIHSVNTNGIKNNSITQRDIEFSMGILGLSQYVAKGKTART